MRIIYRIFFIASGGNLSERPGIDNFPAPERRFKNLTVTAA
jgi:hypothetical protein